MRPIDLLFGPVGAVKVEFTADGATVFCRNGLLNKYVSFTTDTGNGRAIQKWIEDGKRELVQDAVPNLTPPIREMCLSGVTPEEWDEMWKEDEEEEDL